MAGISVSLEGSNIQLAFQKDDQATAVVMDARAARALVRAVGQLLTAIDEPADTEEAEELAEEDIVLKDAADIRDVVNGPDGNLYLLLNGRDALARLVPAQ